MSQAPGVGVGVGIIITKGDEVLLLKRTNVHGAGSWSTPGGHLDFGETPEECAAREAREETGLAVGEVKIIGITNDIFTEYGKHYITIWAKAQYLGGEPVASDLTEMTEIGWYRWDKLPQPLFLPLRNLLEGNSYTGNLSSGQGMFIDQIGGN